MHASSRGRARTKIKAPRTPGGGTSHNESWGKLENAIREIHNHNAGKLSYEETYRNAYNLVINKQGDMVYKGVNRLIEENLDRLAKDEIAPTFPTGSKNDPTGQSQEGEMFLKAMVKVWDDHVRTTKQLSQVLHYMDKFYTQTAGVPVIWDAGLKHFLNHIILSQLFPIKQHLIGTILKQVQLERDGYTINQSAMKSCIDVLLVLYVDKQTTVYTKYLEPELLKESEAFYRREGETLIDECNAPTYLSRTEARFRSEEARTLHYLSAKTHPPLCQILESHLLTPHITAIMSMPQSGLDAMIDQEQYDDLSRMYRLFSKIETGLPSLKRALKESIVRRGKALNETTANPDADGPGEDGEEDVKSKGKAKGKAAAGAVAAALKWVDDVLALKDRFDKVLKNSFGDDPAVEAALNDAYESFINLNQRSPEYISLFIDEHLRKGLKGKTDEEVDVILDKTITVFRFVSEKDVFERYYKTHLAKRLLFNRSTSDDAERGMLAKLKVECGAQFTTHLERMFNDMKVSGDLQSEYKKYIAKTTSPPIELSVIVMTATFWPKNYPTATCTLSTDMMKSCKSFENFYLKRHTGRKLTWQPGLGNADVRTRFRSRTHDLNVSTYALVILLLFEEEDELSYKEIKDATQLADPELKRNLQSLACAKFKILKKHPPSRDVAETDAFSFNIEFSSPMQRIKIGTISSKVENTEERKETQERVEEERKYQIDACIVRIMKDRKRMGHNDLINEAIRQLSSRFAPQTGVLKKRIESLIEREFLERAEDRKSYTYLA